MTRAASIKTPPSQSVSGRPPGLMLVTVPVAVVFAAP
jgi:hypothetical protein